MMRQTDETILHASCVALDGRGLLIRGPSGSGKSAMALALMALGAGLVADDRVIVRRADGPPSAAAPPRLAGLVEARGIGLLRARGIGPVPLVCVLDMEQREAERMPPLRETPVLGYPLPLLYRVETPHFPAMILQYLKEGRAPEA